MEYKPIPDSKAQGYRSPDVEIIEFLTEDDETVHQHARPQNSLPTDVHSTNQYHQRQYHPSQPPPEWPLSQKVYVANLTPWRTTVLVFDVILASTPIVFIVLAILAARYDNKLLTNNGDRLLELLKFSPTIFPVMFAALMGRFFHSLGLYLAERGTTLGLLENFIGAQSIASALERLVCLRSWSLLSFLTVLAWFPSPFGGQAALRVLKQSDFDRQNTSTYPFHYLHPLAFQNSSLANNSFLNLDRTPFTSIFLASILMATSYHWATVDPWSNVKLPMYRTIEANPTGGWKRVPSFDDVLYGGYSTLPSWSSLIGIPVNHSRDLVDADQTNFTFSHMLTFYDIKARQFDIKCSSNQAMSLNESDFGNTNVTWKLDFADPVLGCPDFPCSIISKSLAPTNESSAGELVVSVAHCEVSFEYLQAEISCKNDGTRCLAKRVKKLELYTDEYTKDWDNRMRSDVIPRLMLTMPSSESYGNSDWGSSIMERWMANPFWYIQPSSRHVELFNMTTEDFAESLTVLWNSYFQASYVSNTIDIDMQFNSASQEEKKVGTYVETPATVTTPIRTYQTNWKWFSVLLGCSIFLLAAGYIGLVLKYKTIAPDIIGYASSLTLLNPYVPTPTGGTTLDGLERAALLHNLPVKIGDVCPNDPVGVIAMAKADEGGIGNLDRRRLYM